jgi:hypothetical protein
MSDELRFIAEEGLERKYPELFKQVKAMVGERD